MGSICPTGVIGRIGSCWCYWPDGVICAIGRIGLIGIIVPIDANIIVFIGRIGAIDGST